MSTFVLFGVYGSGIDSVAKDINRALSLELKPRESISIGFYYAYGDYKGERLKLVSKILLDSGDGCPAEPDFPEWNVLLYVDYTGPGFPLLSMIEQRPKLFCKLRTDVI